VGMLLTQSLDTLSVFNESFAVFLFSWIWKPQINMMIIAVLNITMNLFINIIVFAQR
jgi:hypothetical protein